MDAECSFYENIAKFFARIDAEIGAGQGNSVTPSLASNWRSWIATAWENGASWTQLAKWGSETLGTAAIEETAAHFAETHTGLPSYGA